MKNATKVLVASTIAGLVGLSGFMLPASANTGAKNTTAPAQTVAAKPSPAPTTGTMKKKSSPSPAMKPSSSSGSSMKHSSPSPSPAMKKP